MHRFRDSSSLVLPSSVIPISDSWCWSDKVGLGARAFCIIIIGLRIFLKFHIFTNIKNGMKIFISFIKYYNKYSAFDVLYFLFLRIIRVPLAALWHFQILRIYVTIRGLIIIMSLASLKFREINTN